MGEYDSLCAAGRTRGVDDGGYVLGSGYGTFSVAGEFLVVGSYDFEGVYVYDKCHRFRDFRTEFGLQTLGNEYRLAAGMVDDVLELVLGTVREYGNGDTAEGYYAEEGDRPVRHALGEYGYLVAGTYSVLSKELGHGVALVLEVLVGISSFPGVVELRELPLGVIGGGIFVEFCECIYISLAHFAFSHNVKC